MQPFRHRVKLNFGMKISFVCLISSQELKLVRSRVDSEVVVSIGISGKGGKLQ